MKHVRLLVLTEDLPHASLALAEHRGFHADERPPEATELAGLPGRGYRDLYQQARARLDKISPPPTSGWGRSGRPARATRSSSAPSTTRSA
jgi:hypothetical protein